MRTEHELDQRRLMRVRPLERMQLALANMLTTNGSITLRWGRSGNCDELPSCFGGKGHDRILYFVAISLSSGLTN